MSDDPWSPTRDVAAATAASYLSNAMPGVIAAATDATDAIVGPLIPQVAALIISVDQLRAEFDASQPAPDITSLTINGSSAPVLERGATAASLVLVWVIDKAVASQSISVDGGPPISVSAELRTYTVPGAVTDDTSVVLTVTDALAKSDTRSASLVFRLRRRYGPSTTTTLNAAGVAALPSSDLAAGLGSKSVTYNNTGGRYPAYAWPVEWGDLTGVVVGGLPYSAYVVTDASVTSATGQVVPMHVAIFTIQQNSSNLTVIWNG